MYGFEPEMTWETRLKYGAEARLTPLGNTILMLGAGIRRDLAETGMPRLGHPTDLPLWRGLSRLQDARSFILSRMDYQHSKFAFATFELPAHLSVRADYSTSAITPAFDYTFRGDSLFAAEDLSLVLRWGPGEKWMQQGRHKMLQGNHLPVAYARWGRGKVSGSQGWAERYNLAEFTLAQTFSGPGHMAVSYRLQAGFIEGQVPFSRLYVFRGNYAPGRLTDVESTFNTMRTQQFSADQYATGWLELSPRFTWLGVGRLRPQFTFSLGVAWGKVGRQTMLQHDGQIPIAPEKGFFEPGFSIRNILPAPKKDTLLRAFVKAVGIGVYYNAGRYNNPYWQDNLAVRVGFRL
jgi:hypothetical protein